MLDVKSGGQTHHPTNLPSQECGNVNDLFKTSMLRHQSFSSTYQLDPQQHLFDTWAVSACLLRYSHVIYVVWWHPAICNMLQSDSKQNINAFVAIFVAIYAVMGEALAVKSQCR